MKFPLLLALLLCIHSIREAAGSELSETNNGICVAVAAWRPGGDGGFVAAETIRYDYGLVWSPFSTIGRAELNYPEPKYLMKMRMFGPDGKEAAKTTLGKSFGSGFDEVRSYAEVSKGWHMGAVEALGPYDPAVIFTGPVLPKPKDLFVMKKPGLYTMEIQMQIFLVNKKSNPWSRQLLRFSPIRIKIVKPPDETPDNPFNPDSHPLSLGPSLFTLGPKWTDLSNDTQSGEYSRQRWFFRCPHAGLEFRHGRDRLVCRPAHSACGLLLHHMEQNSFRPAPAGLKSDGCAEQIGFMKYRYQYQLVLQLPASSIKDYDALIELENSILANLGTLGRVDGHDAGSGEMNIFILTDHPKLAFERVKQVLGTKDFMPELKVAYREIGKDEYTILHPEGLTQFDVA